MPKGYWIAGLKITDQAKYDAYRAAQRRAPSPSSAASSWCAAASSRTPVGEAWPRTRRHRVPVLSGGATIATTRPNTRRRLTARADGVEIDHVIIEGYDGPQP